MKDFGPIVYLDLQKTGSTYTMKFFRAACRLSPEYRDVHGKVGNSYDPEKFHFITTRHPVGQYVSLFRFGLDGNGTLHRRLKKHGHADALYEEGNEGFNRWLQFILDPQNAAIVDTRYARAAHLDIGLQTYRFLYLAFRKPLQVFKSVTSYDELVARYRQESILDLVIRNEELSSGLRQLATERFPELFIQKKVKEFLGNSERVNASKSSSAEVYKPLGEAKELLERKERFLLTEFYSNSGK